MIGLEPDHLVEVPHRAQCVVTRALHLEVVALQVGLVRLGRQRPRGRGGHLRLRRDLDLDLLRDLAGDLSLQRQDVSHVALVALCPEVRVGARVDQLGGNADPVAEA